MKFTLEIQMDNTAFGENREIELISLLQKTIAQIGRYNDNFLLYDTNGNKVGHGEIKYNKRDRTQKITRRELKKLFRYPKRINAH